MCVKGALDFGVFFFSFLLANQCSPRRRVYDSYVDHSFFEKMHNPTISYKTTGRIGEKGRRLSFSEKRER